MQETTTIPISKEDIQVLKNGGDQENRIVYEGLLQNQDKLHELLVKYHFKNRERVHELVIVEDSVLIKGNEGSFNVKYMTGLFNACADLDHDEKAKMKIQVNLDPEAGIALLTGENIREREPDEF